MIKQNYCSYSSTIKLRDTCFHVEPLNTKFLCFDFHMVAYIHSFLLVNLYLLCFWHLNNLLWKTQPFDFFFKFFFLQWGIYCKSSLQQQLFQIYFGIHFSQSPNTYLGKKHTTKITCLYIFFALIMTFWHPRLTKPISVVQWPATHKSMIPVKG